MALIENIKKDWQHIEDNEYNLISKYPDTIMLELTNACNLKCTMCMNPKMTREKGYITLELVEKVLIEAQEIGIKKIALYTTGESLLHPNFFDIVSLCKQYNMYIYLTTNLLLLNDAKIDMLLASGIDSIKYSIDGLTQEEYESIRIGGDYEKVLHNITMMKQVRDAKGYKVKLLMGIILTDQNFALKEKYLQKYGALVDDIMFSLISNQSGHISKNEYSTMKPESVDISQHWKPCRQLWDRMVVTYDGRLTACCIDFNSVLVYADLNKTSLKESWNSEIMQSFRKEHIKHSFEKMDLCRGCDSPYIQQLSVLEQLNG
jgi:MoaA/NifB/PqqE/SkfB family radical SAM enzyme